jgi:hypothetical protein
MIDTENSFVQQDYQGHFDAERDEIDVKNRGGSYQGRYAIYLLAWHGSGELVDLPGEVVGNQRYVGTKYYCY